MNSREYFQGYLSFIPLRLNEGERKALEVLNQALEVSEYTDEVDVTFSYVQKNKYSRIMKALSDLLSISSGLMLATNLTKGEKIVSGKKLDDNFELFRDLFEIGRRYKIMNPSKMRNTYGKLIYMLMDTESEMIKRELNFSFCKPILTVDRFLKEKNLIDMLEDTLLFEASQEIVGESHEMQKLLAKKKTATQELITKYGDQLHKEEIIRVLDSIGDIYAYRAFNVAPVRAMINLLTSNFDPQNSDDYFNLSLNGSRSRLPVISNMYYSLKYMGGGASLCHDHATQYAFVLQSLTLWENIMNRMPQLWYFADLDMTKQSYNLANTGQGYQRVQSCPRVAKCMSDILSSVKSRFSNWVGLSVVHLGDRDVPNALVFIDKYVQVPRILSPIVNSISNLEAVDDEIFHRYVQSEWESEEKLRKQILSDFFKHGFDGSGDDGGSCIDGRLTSAWNWCSKLHKKPYYYVFLLTGFQGFDGDFK